MKSNVTLLDAVTLKTLTKSPPAAVYESPSSTIPFSSVMTAAPVPLSRTSKESLATVTPDRSMVAVLPLAVTAVGLMPISLPLPKLASPPLALSGTDDVVPVDASHGRVEVTTIWLGKLVKPAPALGVIEATVNEPELGGGAPSGTIWPRTSPFGLSGVCTLT